MLSDGKNANSRCPLDEQRCIVAKLDSLFARSKHARDELARNPRLVERTKQGILADAFSGQLTTNWREQHSLEMSGTVLLEHIRVEHNDWCVRNQHENKLKAGKPNRDVKWKQRYKLPEPVDESDVSDIPASWAWISGRELVELGAEIVYGIVQPRPKLDDGVPYVRGMDIENGRILVSQLMKTSPAIAERYSRTSLAGGDVLLGIIRATKVAIVPEELAGGNITQGTARFRPASTIRTAYLARALEAPATQAWLHTCSRGIDMPGLNLADVRRVPIPLAPLLEQDEIVRRIEAAFTRIDRLPAEAAHATALLDRLEQATLAKAFRGELSAVEGSVPK